MKRESWQDLFGEGILFVGGMPEDILIGWQSMSGFKIIQEIAKEADIDLKTFESMINNMNEDNNPCLILTKIKNK